MFSSNNEPTGLGVNRIFKKTGGKDKKPITDSIKHLEKAGLLETKRSTQHMQVRLKRPTELGKEFIDFMDDMDKYNTVSLKFRDKVKQLQKIVDCDNEKLIKSKFREMGWNSEEIDFYKEFATYAWYNLGPHLWSPAGIIDITITKYISLLAKLGSYNKNEMAGQILYHITMNEISDQFKSVVSSEKLNELSLAYNRRSMDKWHAIVAAVMRWGVLDHDFIKNEFKDLMFHALHILTPIERQIEVLGEEIDEQVKYFDDIKDEIHARRARLVQSICREAYKH